MKTTVNRQNFKETAEIGETIRNLRKNSGLTQNALAEYLHISRQCVSKWECAKNLPDVQQIVQLSDFFGVTTDFLLKKFNPPPPSDKLSTIRLVTGFGGVSTLFDRRRRRNFSKFSANFLYNRRTKISQNRLPKSQTHDIINKGGKSQKKPVPKSPKTVFTPKIGTRRIYGF